jgi:hypothetical protein
MSRRFNRESNLKILQRLEKEQRKERINKLADKFRKPIKKKKKTIKNKFTSDCENDSQIYESRFKRKV